MREIAVAPLVEPYGGGLADLIYTNAAEAPDTVTISRNMGGTWKDVTAAQFKDEVIAVAKGLIGSGVGAGDRVAILAATRYEWTLFDFAIWAAGGVPVPIYVTSSDEQIQWILSDSGAVAVVAENDALQAKVESVRANTPALKQVWNIEKGAVDEVVAAGANETDEAVDDRRKAVKASDTATLIYTSGTTGRPKGCVLTHANFHSEGGNVVEMLAPVFKGLGPGDTSTLLFLPLAHVFGRMVEVGTIMARTRLGHTADIKKVTEDLATFKPTFILSVPYVLEKVYNGARQKAHSGGKGKIFDAAAAVAIAYSEADGKAGLGLKLKHALFDKLVYSKLRAALGGNAKYAISGGAALGLRLTHFFRGVGLVVFEGYGLTETCAAATVNSPDKFKPGTVGHPLPNTAVRIAEDGEIQIKGGQVFPGYWQNEDATKAALDDDGWFATGDLGELDDEGFLKITGRKKEILVTSGGKNVAPAVIEDRIAAHPLVGQAMVVGDGKSYIAALITIEPDYFTYWKSTTGKPASATVADLVDDAELNAEIQRAVDDGNLAVSKAESVRRFRILTTEFSPETGHLTPSLKLKRSVIMADFSSDVDALYS
ncbi:AMP-dependent synthetase/ligase [Kibdelosporangium phytohabitans]|uniref:Acyl-CoA synthetase n=1 Tax=Kibdelosporangium phytohabitans TaxID=860235 RepID=A0A0N9HV85_9PSEU|nr:AMP-dependent synthetase/ligase [Kibdelosporangium phytohabitans]ALG06112.1 long-chain fatty acid--CoA ligase [Kibdelosporangium phytohabitans]MBE1465798.1 long-chain acyl-CoA synthetase [Kibdelosporangium phytohabitans]